MNNIDRKEAIASIIFDFGYTEISQDIDPRPPELDCHMLAEEIMGLDGETVVMLREALSKEEGRTEKLKGAINRIANAFEYYFNRPEPRHYHGVVSAIAEAKEAANE